MIPLPSSLKLIVKKDNYAEFTIEGLYPGYGFTVGNSLRRVLLSSLKGAAITDVKFKGVSHEFSTIPGVMEDIIHICLNLKKLRFKNFSEEPIKAILKVKGAKEVTGKDFVLPTDLELINKDQKIATLTSKTAELEMEIVVRKGVGYEPKEARESEKLEIGEISLDAIFTPVRNVSYRVENMRVGQRTDFDKLFIEIETDGTIQPENALMEANKLLLDHFSVIDNGIKELAETDKPKKIEKAEEEKPEIDAAEVLVEDMKLSTRTVNALTAGHIKTAAGLAKKSESSLLELEGLGDKGIKEIKKSLKKLGLELKAE
ncbi:MAG: DNA-directed RNA polymerase subunit alpha [Candidatus Pacebacteria bacterium]|nr:DNA-directed RNA polymerase subunit alpha [Candidatus Paceibacterota bacterium]